MASIQGLQAEYTSLLNIYTEFGRRLATVEQERAEAELEIERVEADISKLNRSIRRKKTKRSEYEEKLESIQERIMVASKPRVLQGSARQSGDDRLSYQQ